MTAGQKRFDDWLAGRAEQAGGRAAFLRADGRADESHWESIRRNVFSLFRDVLSAAQKANGGEEQAARRFFAEKLGVIPASWETAPSLPSATSPSRSSFHCAEDLRRGTLPPAKRSLTSTMASPKAHWVMTKKAITDTKGSSPVPPTIAAARALASCRFPGSARMWARFSPLRSKVSRVTAPERFSRSF